MLIEKLKEMFEEMVHKKKAALIPVYYHPDFLLYTNEETMNYAEYVEFHEDIYATPIQYHIEYDEETLLEQGDKLAARVWITTNKTNEPARKIEVMLIAQYKEGRIYRLWELTYPDWSKMPAFT